LRIEAGLPRYGHELNETIDPITAGLAGAVDWGRDFLGAGALGRLRDKAPARTLVGLTLKATDDSSAVPRMGAAVTRPDGGEVGTVTSGTFSPTLDRTIALAYVAADAADEGAELLVEGESKTHSAQVAPLPFCGKHTT
jgi:aminomethyltransferase